MRRATFLVGLALTGGAGCALVTGLSEYSVMTDAGGGGADGSSPGPADARAPDGAASPDGATPRPDGASTPTYCNGLTLYLPFDGKFDSAEGDAPASVPSGFALVDGGVRGGALDLTANRPIYFPIEGDAGSPRWTKQAGSIALWIKPRWSFASVGGGYLARQASSASSIGAAGPALIHVPGAFGFATSADSGAAVSTGWREGDWNHLVGTWTKAPDVLTVTLNGTFRGQLNGAWDTSEAGRFIRLGTLDVPNDGLMDEAALWTRALLPEEIQALEAATRAGRSIGDACGLR